MARRDRDIFELYFPGGRPVTRTRRPSPTPEEREEERRKGMALFEELFADRLYPPEVPEEVPERTPSPTPEEREEERRKGMALFEELFADRLYPPEVPEEVPEPTPPREESPFVEELSPVKSYRGPTPPKWLTHSMDRDLFPNQTRPDWFTRFYDESYPMSPIKPPYPPSPRISPPYWDISEILQLEPPGDKSSLFMTPPPPAPPKTPEPPLPEFIHHSSSPPTSFDIAMHKMHWELQKYEHDKDRIVEFVKMAPLIRDTEILTKELEALVRMYVPDVNTDKMGSLIAFNTLEDYIKITEGKLKERYGEEISFEYKYPGISEEVLTAQVRLHKQKALEAIKSYKRAYFIAKAELNKAEVELRSIELEIEIESAKFTERETELNRMREEEKKAELEYEEHKMIRHYEDCPFIPQVEAMIRRQHELGVLIPKMKEELQKTKEAYERDVKNMESWLTLFPPNFVDNLNWLLQGCLNEGGYTPVPVEKYMKMMASMENDLWMKKDSRARDLKNLNRQFDLQTKLLEKYMAELEEARRYTNHLLEEQENLRTELNNIRFEVTKRKDLWAKLRLEYIYYKEYNTMLLGKLIALHADSSLRSENLPAIAGPRSRSPSPVGIAPTGISPASPPAFGSETFNISPMESSPRLDESSGLLNEERPPSGILNISDQSGSGGSPGYESIPQDQAQSDYLDDERPPSGMLNISDQSGSGGSPGYESIPQDQAQSDYLDDERPPSGMLDFSDQSGSGGSPGYESIPQDQAQSDYLDDERPPSGILDFSDKSGSGGSPGYESIPQDQAQSDNIGDERPPSELLDFSGLQGGASFLDSPEDSGSSGKKTVVIPSPGKMEQLRMDVEIIPQDIRRSPSGQRVVCDVSVQMQEAAVRPPRRIERRYHVVRGTPPISETVGRRVDRRHGMFTPRSVIRRRHVGVRRPLFEGDFESPESPWGTGRRTHPELMNLPRRPPSPRPPPLNTTIEWEDPDMNMRFRE